MPPRKTPADYHALAEKRGFRWLGPEVSNTETKTWWECNLHHRWAATYHNIRGGTGCPVCAGNVPKTPSDFCDLAAERGFRWLGPEVPNTHTKTWWECQHGHRWQAPYSNIKQGSGCPGCAGLTPKTPDDYHALAAERSFRWVGPRVDNVFAMTWWECEQGHRWKTKYNAIQQGSGCPVCAVQGRAEKHRLGQTDYHTLAAEQGIRWLGPEVPDTKTKTTWECEQGHRWKTNYNSIHQGRGCPVCADRIPKTPDDYHTLASERGFRWLGPEVPDTKTKTTWECQEGHQWEAPYGNVQQGSGCLVCAGKAPKTPDDYHALANERGFRWLGPEVPNNATKTCWECEQGHRWEAPYSSLQQGRGCPTCVDMVHGARVSQIQRDLCEMLGGELNKPFGSYNIDVALRVNGVPIAVEYDCWYWHAGREENEAQRDTEMIAAGWRVLRVRSNTQLPTRKQLDVAIDRLLAGEQRVEMVLEDWGEGPTRFETE